MTDPLKLDEIWKAIKGELEVVSNPAHFKAHIPGTYIKQIDENDKVLEITCPSEFQRNIIEDRFYGHLKEITNKVMGSGYRLMFSVTKKEPEQIQLKDFGPLFGQKDPDDENLSSRVKTAGLNERYNIERFIVGNHNRLAYAVSTAIADAPGQVYNPFFLYSGVGLGKTHLVHAIGQEIMKKHPEKTVIYKTGEQFLNEVVEAVRKGKSSNQERSDLKRKYRNADVLIIDDVHSIAGKPSTQEEFFHTFNTLYMAQKQIILTSDRAPSEIKTLEERLSSRFASGMIADIQKPDVETKIAILRERNEELNLQAPDKVIEFLATSIDSSIRELEAALIQTVTKARAEGRDLSVDTTSSIYGQISSEKLKRISPTIIVREVSKYYGITVKDIKSERRLKNLVIPRQVAMFLLRDMVEMGYQAIGEVLGNRDHTTVMHGIEKVQNNISQNTSFTKELEQIKANIIQG